MLSEKNLPKARSKVAAVENAVQKLLPTLCPLIHFTASQFLSLHISFKLKYLSESFFQSWIHFIAGILTFHNSSLTLKRSHTHLINTMHSRNTNFHLWPADCFPFMTLPIHYFQKNKTLKQVLMQMLDRYHRIRIYSKEKWQISSASSSSNKIQTAAFFNWVSG